MSDQCESLGRASPHGQKRRVRCKLAQGHKGPHGYWCKRGRGVCGYWNDKGEQVSEFYGKPSLLVKEGIDRLNADIDEVRV